MRAFGLLLFCLALLCAGVAVERSALVPLAAFSLAAAVACLRARPVSIYLRIFIGLFATEAALFGLASVLAETDRWPAALSALRVPTSLPISADVFCLVAYVLSFVPAVRRAAAIGSRYFGEIKHVDFTWPPLSWLRVSERSWAIATVVLLVLLRQIEVVFAILTSFAMREMLDAIQAYEAAAFWRQILVVLPLLGLALAGLHIVERLASATLGIRWRQWLTQDYIERWLGGHTHYRMMLAGASSDNPDQRIAEDVGRFHSELYAFSISLVGTLSSLVSYSMLLWALSAGLAVPGTHVVIPGLLLWCAMAYAAVSSAITHLLGRPLAPLSFASQHLAADFRFSLARLREYGEQVALLDGEAREIESLRECFRRIVANYYSILFVELRLTVSTTLLSRYSNAIPYAVTAPFYFTRQIKFGLMQQVSQAFGTVSVAFGFFVYQYRALADFASVLVRLESFDRDLDGAATAAAIVRRPAAETSGLALSNLSLRLPSGAALTPSVDLELAPGETVVLTGPSGSGKSTLVRAVAGIWPYGDGLVQVPEGARVMVLPQKAYLPIGTLRDAVCYPNAMRNEDAAVAAALQEVELGALVEKLDVATNWTQILSGGEQQRLGIVRALLAEPDWLFLDEATTALEPAMAQRMLALMARRLPGTSLISVAHYLPASTVPYRHLMMQPSPNGRFTPRDALAAAE